MPAQGPFRFGPTPSAGITDLRVVFRGTGGGLRQVQQTEGPPASAGSALGNGVELRWSMPLDEGTTVGFSVESLAPTIAVSEAYWTINGDKGPRASEIEDTRSETAHDIHGGSIGDLRRDAMEENLTDAVLTDEGAIVIGRKVCPPKREVFWQLVDSGVHKGNAVDAAKAALAAYQQAYPAQVQKAENDANNFVRTAKCGEGCTRNGTMVLGLLHSTQEWAFTGDAALSTVQTSSWVGYEGIVFCARAS